MNFHDFSTASHDIANIVRDVMVFLPIWQKLMEWLNRLQEGKSDHVKRLMLPGTPVIQIDAEPDKTVDDRLRLALDHIEEFFRESDRFWNATAMAKVYSETTGIDKRPQYWLDSKLARTLIDSVAAKAGIPALELTKVVKGGSNPGTWIHPLLVYAFAQWLSPEFYVLVSTHLDRWHKQPEQPAIASQRAQLERVYDPASVPTMAQISEATDLFGRWFGEAYAQRYVMAQAGKHHPQLVGDAPRREEMASLPSPALLTPTQIAAELGWHNASGKPDARRVNRSLAELGYQAKIQGRWSATPKANGLCDRKPVDTGSRTQKDQLLWSANIVVVLKEYVA